MWAHPKLVGRGQVQLRWHHPRRIVLTPPYSPTNFRLCPAFSQTFALCPCSPRLLSLTIILNGGFAPIPPCAPRPSRSNLTVVRSVARSSLIRSLWSRRARVLACRGSNNALRATFCHSYNALPSTRQNNTLALMSTIMNSS